MNTFLLAAALLLVAVGLIHSVLGEVLIFRRMRKNGLVPTEGGDLLRESHTRILWASWHIQTLLGWCIAYVLFGLAALQPSETVTIVGASVSTAMLGASALVFVGTRARHPGWAGLLGVAVLVWAGS